jgi:hypothetical protein
VPNSVRVTSGTLVGRDEELRATLTTLRDLREARSGVVTVSGPAGIGKTRFVTALADRLRADGVRVMSGACLDLGAGSPPYAALISVFRSVDPPAVQLLDALTGAVGMRRSRLFELLRSTMAALARRRPTVLIVEDVHWLDRVTRDAMLYLTAMVRDGHWALVVTYRDDEVASRPPVRELLESLRRDALVYVALDSLSQEGVVAQIAAITGTPASPKHAARIYGRSGGIPLLVEEVLAAEASGATGVPDHLRDLSWPASSASAVPRSVPSARSLWWAIGALRGWPQLSSTMTGLPSRPRWTGRSLRTFLSLTARATGCAMSCSATRCTRRCRRRGVEISTPGSPRHWPPNQTRIHQRWHTIGTKPTSQPTRPWPTSRQLRSPNAFTRQARCTHFWSESSSIRRAAG